MPRKELPVKATILSLSVTLAALLGGGVTAQGPACGFALQLEPGVVQFTLKTDTTPALGAVIVSFSPDLTHYFVGLPPILTDFAVLSVDVLAPDMVLRLPEHAFPPGILIYTQGVVAAENGVSASKVARFVLDASPGS
jgi:hypothetical protein